MKLLVASFCLLLCMNQASADIWLCVGDNGRQSIQDKPCGKGMREKSHVEDAPRRPRGAKAGKQAAKPLSRTPVEVGLQRNKTVICKLLDSEKADTLAQIGGTAPPPPGEDPKSNLVKIEKQRSRVGCDVG